MRMPLLWLNLILAITLGMIYYQPTLLIPEKPVDYVLIAAGPADGDLYGDAVSGAENFERDWQKNVTVLEGSDDPRTLARTLKYAMSLKPRGISMPGSEDAELLMPFVTEAARRGVLITFHSTPMPSAITQFGRKGTGYVGTNSEMDGELTTRRALARLAQGDPAASVLVIGSDAELKPGTRAYGCVEGAKNAGSAVEYLHFGAGEKARASSEATLKARLARPPLPTIIVWDAGPVSPLTAELELQGYEAGATSVVTFSITTGLPLGQQFFLRMQNDDKTMVATYMSLVQLYLSNKYKVAGMSIPLTANL